MPNHITTILRIEGTAAQVKEVLNFIKGEETCIDFNKIVPMPETYRKYDTTNHPHGKGLEIGMPISWEEDAPIATPELIAEYKAATHEQAQKYGVVGWYDWSHTFWGTKWNAYDTEALGDGTIQFSTAWNFPRPVIVALSKQFPEVEFVYTYADENASYNTGTGRLKAGLFVERDYPEGGSPEGWRNYFFTHEDMEEYYQRQEDGTYKYVED